MTEIGDLVRREALAAELDPDAAEQPGTIATRGPAGRGLVFSIRLSAEEHAMLAAAAERAGIPVSALARTWIIERLASDDGTTELHLIAEALATYSRRLGALTA